MIHLPKIQLISFTIVVLIASLVSMRALAEPNKIGNATYRMSDVRVDILEVYEEGSNAGKVRLIGECRLCDQTFEINGDTSLHTAFYRGDMDLAMLEEQQFAKGTVTVNSSSMTVLAINYMGQEY